jgi:hypothetical protein
MKILACLHSILNDRASWGLCFDILKLFLLKEKKKKVEINICTTC